MDLTSPPFWRVSFTAFWNPGKPGLPKGGFVVYPVGVSLGWVV